MAGNDLDWLSGITPEIKGIEAIPYESPISQAINALAPVTPEIRGRAEVPSTPITRAVNALTTSTLSTTGINTPDPYAYPGIKSSAKEDFVTEYLSDAKKSSMLSASIGMGISGLAGLFSTLMSRKIFDLYKDQEKAYIENANIQAKRIQIQGNIKLANLRAEHAITQGQNELAVAGAGAGSITGSFLDKLMANRKYDTREEYATDLSTLYAVSNAKREGLINAINTAGQAQNQAYTQRNNAITSFLNSLSGAVASVTKDYQEAKQVELSKYNMEKQLETERLKHSIKWAVPTTTSTGTMLETTGEIVNSEYKAGSSESTKLESSGANSNPWINTGSAI